MPAFRAGTVLRVVFAAPGLQRLEVRTAQGVRRAVLFTRFAAPAKPGDRVILNTTADDLGLGSGGQDFVVWNAAVDEYTTSSGGHIMKLRYTPAQTDVLSVEAPESPHHHTMSSATSVGGMPVVAASLHSQLLPVVVCIRARAPGARVAYVMTDGAALEASFSDTVRRLKELEWLCGVITAGHAVGGDFEAVGVHSALLAARHILACDVAVVGMGPGVVGTSTPFGTTGLELGLTVNAAAAVDGHPIACVRMSSADKRRRHAGLSHHSLVSLSRVALARADVPVPLGLRASVAELESKHNVVEVDTRSVLDEIAAAEKLGLHGSHMGRRPGEDDLFFRAAGAAGYHTAALLTQSSG